MLLNEESVTDRYTYLIALLHLAALGKKLTAKYPEDDKLRELYSDLQAIRLKNLATLGGKR